MRCVGLSKVIKIKGTEESLSRSPIASPKMGLGLHLVFDSRLLLLLLLLLLRVRTTIATTTTVCVILLSPLNRFRRSYSVLVFPSQPFCHPPGKEKVTTVATRSFPFPRSVK